MQILRKIASGAIGLLMAGSSFAAGAFAGDLSTINTDFTPENAIVVVGADAKTDDVVGAINIAAAMGTFGTTTTVAGTAAVGVSGGVSLDTPGNRITLGETIASSKTTLTASDLPDLLASGQFSTKDGKSYDYSQYIVLGDGATDAVFTFAKPSGEDTPDIGVVQAGVNDEVYEYRLTFAKRMESTKANVETRTLSILGTPYTISAATGDGATKISLDLVGGQNTAAVSTSDTAGKVFTLDTKTYTVKLTSVGTDQALALTATLDVNGQTVSLNAGSTTKLTDGTEVGVVTIIQGKTGAPDTATVVVGASKITLEDANAEDNNFDTSGFKIGGTSVTGVTVRIVGDTAAANDIKISEIDVQYDPSTEVFVKSGKSIDDGTFKAFKILNGGITPAAGSSDLEKIDVLPSSTTQTRASFKLKQGQTLTQDVIRRTAANAYALQATTTPDAITVIEPIDEDDINFATLADPGGNNALDTITTVNSDIALNGYVVVSQGGFGHILRLISADKTDAAAGTVKFTDVNTGQTIEVTVTGADNDIYRGRMYLDGFSYVVYGDEDGDDVPVRIKTNVAGTIDVFPVLETSKGAKIAFTEDNVDDVDDDTTDAAGIQIADELVNDNGAAQGTVRLTVNLPTGSFCIEDDGTDTGAGADGGQIDIGCDSDGAAPDVATFVNNRGSIVVGEVRYVVTIMDGAGADDDAQDVFIFVDGGQDADLDDPLGGVDASDDGGAGSATGDASILILQERDENNEFRAISAFSSDTTAGNIQVAGPLWWKDGAAEAIAGVNVQLWPVGTTNKDEAYSAYGTKVTYDRSGTQNSATFWYPDYQSYGTIVVGKSPSTTATAAGNVTTFVAPTLPSTTGLSALDTERPAGHADRSAKNIIVVGGPAVNRLAAELLNLPYPTKGQDAATAMGIGNASTNGGIWYFADKFATGRVALLVAGYEAAGTREAARRVMAGGLTGTKVTF